MSRARRKAGLLALGLVAALALAPVTAAIAQVYTGDYEPSSQTLTLPMPGGVVPRLSELANPPRLVIDFPAVDAIQPRSQSYATGLVARYDAARTARGARITLTLRRPLRGQYRVGFAGDRLLVTLTPVGGYPMAVATPKPRPTPRPIRPVPPVVVYPTAPPEPYPTYLVYPAYPTEPPAWMPGMPTPRPHPRPVPTSPIATAPTPRITPVPISPPTPIAVAPTATPGALPTPIPTPVPTPEATPPVPIAMITPEPLPSLTPPPQLPTDAVFGSRLAIGAAVPLSLTETYPRGNEDAEVDTVPGADVRWDVLFTPNFGSTVHGRWLGYSFADQAAAARGFTVQHRRDDFDTTLGVFGRLPLPFGFELMGSPGLRIRTMQGAVSGGPAGGNLAPLSASDYLSSGWLGVGGSFAGGLGWRVFGPLALVGTGEVGYLSGGKMFSGGLTPVFPMFGYRAGGELRLDFGAIGLAAGYEVGHWDHSSSTPGDVLTEDWSGPTGSLTWLF